MKLWIVNQYAISPNQPGHTRHWALAEEMSRDGIDSLIIASPTSYMTRAPSNLGSRMTTHGAVNFLWISAPAYRGNGLGRVINMVAFAVKAVVLPVTLLLRGQLDRPDAVIGSSPTLFSAASAWCLAHLTRSPFVLEVRDIHPKSIVALGSASNRHPYVILLSLLENFLYRQAEVIVSPLQGLGAHVAKTIGREPDWIWVPNSVDFELTPQPTPPRDDPHPFRITYAGAHGIPNALEIVVRAAKLLEDDAVEFLLIGDGVAKGALIEEAARLEVTNVTFHAPVPKSDVFRYLEGSDALVVPVRNSKLYDDGLSLNKLYDYMASGRPVVIATNAQYNPVAESRAGVTVAPDNPEALAAGIRELTAMPHSERTMMGRRGREHVQNHYALRTTAAALAERLTKLGRERIARV